MIVYRLDIIEASTKEAEHEEFLIPPLSRRGETISHAVGHHGVSLSDQPSAPACITSAQTRRKFSPQIFRMSPSLYPFFSSSAIKTRIAGDVFQAHRDLCHSIEIGSQTNEIDPDQPNNVIDVCGHVTNTGLAE